MVGTTLGTTKKALKPSQISIGINEHIVHAFPLQLAIYSMKIFLLFVALFQKSCISEVMLVNALKTLCIVSQLSRILSLKTTMDTLRLILSCMRILVGFICIWWQIDVERVSISSRVAFQQCMQLYKQAKANPCSL